LGGKDEDEHREEREEILALTAQAVGERNTGKKNSTGISEKKGGREKTLRKRKGSQQNGSVLGGEDNRGLLHNNAKEEVIHGNEGYNMSKGRTN